MTIMPRQIDMFELDGVSIAQLRAARKDGSRQFDQAFTRRSRGLGGSKVRDGAAKRKQRHKLESETRGRRRNRRELWS